MEAGYIPVGETSSAGHVVPGNTVVAPVGNVIRAPGLKRGKMEEAITDRIKLESVLGLTVGSNAALDCDPNTELVAYPAGCTVVLYNPRKNRQTHVLNACRKSVSCVAFSPDGRYLATGECGHAPAVRVWDLQDPTASGAVQIGEFPGHTHGVSCVAFSTSSKYLVSVGSQHDMIVNVWDWRSNLKLASNKVSSRVKAVSFAENGNYFVTVGFRHVKFWYLEYSRSAKFKEPVPLMGRSAILGEQKDNEFCDVVCGRGEAADSTYAITRSGLLCEFNSRRLLDKWVELRTTSANCMAIGSKYIFIGCAESIVRCFSPLTLEFVTTLPRTHFLGVDVFEGTNLNHMFSKPQNAKYPDAIALTYDERNHKLTCVYNDHSLYVWDVRDIKRVGKSHSALYHSACIWGVDMLNAEGSSANSFITCSSDDTVRFWQINRQSSNIYSNELNKILYIDQDLKFLKDVDLTAFNEKDKSKSYDDKTGVRCVKISPNNMHIASGDRAGNVWVHCASTGRRLHVLEAHDAEVLCLSYTHNLLASASRDRLVHVFRADRGYQILQTLDDHSSSITAVRFISSGSNLQMVSCGADKTILFRQLVTSPEGNMSFARGINISGRSTLYDMEADAGGRHVLAACQDRNVRVYSTTSGKHTKTFRGTTAEDGTLIKVALDSSGIYLATSSTDKILSVYDYYSGECMATMYGHSEIVTGLRFTPDCQHLISASGDGCIFVWRVPHDMVVTMKARLAQQRMRQGKKAPSSTNGMSGLDSETDSYFGSPPREIPYEDNKFTTPVVPDYTLRIGRLPSWAKKSLGDELPTGETPAPEPPARGKWAKRINQNSDKRVDSDGSKDSSLDSGTDTRSVDKRREFTPKQRPKSLNLSQLSSVEALFRNFDAKLKKTFDILTISPRVEKVTLTTPARTPEPRSRHHTDDSSLGSFKFEDLESTEHDGDIEDISDGERTSSSGRGNRTMYYPANNDDGTPGEFMVNAMDVEELRQSQRRSKRWKAEVRLDLPTVTGTSLSGSDDDEVSTPSGDNADRNPLSGSCESIDTAGRREKFLKSAFDSLSGAELDSNMPGTTSLSSKHLSRRPILSPLDAEAARRRHDLQRRIQETKRQLDTVGRTNLKSSQSTTDLSYIPEKDCNARSPSQSARGRPVSMAIPSNTRSAGPYNPMNCPEEFLDSLNYCDSLNTYQQFDYRTKNPYAIPANLNHRIIPSYDNMKPYVPPHANLTIDQVDKRPNFNFNQNVRPMVFKEQLVSENQRFSVEMGNVTNTINSKVFNRLFPTNPVEDKTNAPPKIPPRNLSLNLNKNVDVKPQSKIVKPPHARSIFKNYKSCPVSPVSEECKWADKIAQNNGNITQDTNSLDAKKRNSLSFFVGMDDNSMLLDRGQSIMESIKSDTEKMIAEITKKYGDLDEYEPREPNLMDLDMHPTKEVYLEKDEGNFSSDSLEDCSLSQDASCKNKMYSKKVCRKHNKARGLPPRRAVSNYEISGTFDKPILPAKPSYVTNQKSSTLPRNMPSNLDEIMDEENAISNNYNNMYRCQSVLTKRCITTSNESVLSDNSNGSSVSNEIFLKYGNEVAFQQTKLDHIYHLNNSQNCSFDNVNEPDDHYFDSHRHSSASFFLNQKKYMKSSCSQESILSDDMSADDARSNYTHCNSLESVLSDDSECTKSAPLEMLFVDARMKQNKKKQSIGIPKTSKSCYEFENTSKSYGSSPNNVPYFGGYMYNNYMNEGRSPEYKEIVNTPSTGVKKPTTTVYGFDVPVTESSVPQKTVTRSRSLYDSSSKQAPPPAKSIAYYFDGNNIQQYTRDKKILDDIPRLSTVNYMTNKTRSLQPQFPEKDKYTSKMEGCEPTTTSMVKSKSCSFEVVLEPATKRIPLKSAAEKKSSHVQRNLEKFEEQIRKNAQGKSNKNHVNKENANNNNKPNNITKSLERGSGQKNYNNKIVMDFVPHKPPKPIKRTASAKINNRNKSGSDKSGLSTTITPQYKAKLDGLHEKKYLGPKKRDKNSNKVENTASSSEKTFEIFVKEKDVNENKSEMQMDSLEVFSTDRHKQMSLDSLDVLEDNFATDSLDYYAEQDNKNYPKYRKDQINCTLKCIDTNNLNRPSHSLNTDSRAKENINPEDLNDEIKKFKYIERKIEIINKLVEMEERKILQEKYIKEWRMRPLKANLNDGKGVVKVLSRKFEKLAKKQTNFTSVTLEEIDTDTENNSDGKEIKRNLSLPDILDSEQIGGLITDFESAESTNECGNTEFEKGTEETEKLNNTISSEVPKLPPRFLKQRVYNEMVIPKTDIHIDSENYESSTTSSSCTNSPKRFRLFAKNRIPTAKRPIIRMPVPRLCMENKILSNTQKVRPFMSRMCGVGYSSGTNCSIAKRVPFQPQLAPTAASRNHLSPYQADDDNAGMRRAISLSDLAVKPTPAPRSVQGSGKLSSPNNAAAVKSPSGFMRPAPRYSTKSSMTRSSSVGVLNNQSDSESDPQPTARGSNPNPRGSQGLMRPTISSMNKAAANVARRRGMSSAYSAVSLSTGGQEGSSSEAEDRERPTNVPNKPAVPPRPRAVSVDHKMGRSGSERDLSAKAREVTARLTAPTRSRTSIDITHNTSGDTHQQLSSIQLCNALAEQLTKTAGKVVQLYKTLQSEPRESEAADNAALICGLETAMLETQKVLQGAVLTQAVSSNGRDTMNSLSSNEDNRDIANTKMKLEQLVTSSENPNSSNSALALFEQYSDILLNMMQSKMVNQFGQSPQSLPPNPTREPGTKS